MADAEIKLTANAEQAKKEINDLRAVVDRFIASTGATGKAAKQAGDLLEKTYRDLGVSAADAEKALGSAKEQVTDFGLEADTSAISMQGLGKALFVGVSVAAVMKSSLEAVKDELGPLNEHTDRLAEGLGLAGDKARIFSLLLEGMINPLVKTKNEIAAWKLILGEHNEEIRKEEERIERVNAILRENRKEVEENAQALADRTEALAWLVEKEQKAGEVTAHTRELVAELTKEYEKTGSIPPKLDAIRIALGIMTKAEQEAAKEAEKLGEEQERALKKAEEAAKRSAQAWQDAVRKEVESIESSNEQLRERTRLHLEAVNAVERDGTVTAEAAEEIKQKNTELLELYKRHGTEVPAELRKIVDEYGEVRDASTAAADAQVENSRRVVDALRNEISALQDRNRAEQGEAGEATRNLSDAEAKAQALRDKGALTAEESEELIKLESEIIDLRKEATKQNQEAADSADALAAAQDELAFNEEVLAQQTEAANREITTQADAFDQQAAALGVTRQELENAGDAGGYFRGTLEEAMAAAEGTTDAVNELGVVVDEFGNIIEDPLAGAREGLDGVTEGAFEAAEGVETLADSTQELSDANEGNKGTGKVRSDMKETRDLIAECNELWREFIRLSNEAAGAVGV